MRKVRVRIAVAVDPDGNWNSCGWSSGDDEQKLEIATEDLQHGESRYWLTAELEVPDVAEIQAEIERAE
jgi:hypothetical protein